MQEIRKDAQIVNSESQEDTDVDYSPAGNDFGYPTEVP